MKEKLKKLILVSFFPALIIFIAGVIALKSFTPNTFLLGWDSLHPEFNFSEAFSRALLGVWRTEQGVGAVAAHAHMADLPRILVLWLVSYVFPTSTLRYIYILVCILIGPLGVYKLLNYLFKGTKENFSTRLASFLGAMFYLLNLGTLQHFIVPFEMFPTAFAFLPWMFWGSLKTLKEGGEKNLLIFSLIAILAMPMAYAPALFYASFAGLILFLFLYSLITQSKKQNLKRVIGIVLLVFALNSYWILPNLYSLKNQSKVIEQAKINQLFSPEAFLRNQDYGTLSSILIQKNFLFSWRVFDFQKNTYVDLMDSWSKYLQNPYVLNIGYALGIISFLGVLLALVKRDRVAIAFLPPLFFALFFLININPPTGFVYSYLYDHFGIFKEGFRMPFTKFSILYTLVTAFYFGFFFNFVFEKLSKLKIGFITSILLTFIILSSLSYFMLPAFGGGFISKYVKVNLPAEYSQLFSWFKSRPGRIAVFPIQTLWGWGYKDWGYQGSGFLGYGISNPILDRDYDRWSPYNETFYEQASTALYSNDLKSLEDTLKKYQVKYILLDASTLNAGASPELLRISATKEMFLSSDKIKLVAKIGFLDVYEVLSVDSLQDSPVNYVSVNTNNDYSQVDPIYSTYGDYIQNEMSPEFPFASLDPRAGVKVQDKGSYIELTSPSGVEAKINVDKKDVVIEDFSKKRGFATGFNCDLKKVGEVFKENYGDRILYLAKNSGVACDYFDYPLLEYQRTYLIHLVGENTKGRSLKIYLYNHSTKRMDLEELLPSGKFNVYYFISEKKLNGAGYSLNLETRSFGRLESENILQEIEFIPVPYSELVFYDAPTLTPKVQSNLTVQSILTAGKFMYQYDVKGDGLLVLGQGYEAGWKAILVNNAQLTSLKHVRANSWENGWIVPEPTVIGQHSTVVIFYWPQILEWLGFVIMIGVLPVVLVIVMSRLRYIGYTSEVK
ncbi:hypothetical protein HY045_02970 [Candidatus Woesebacteria bacterium]|nr:hypothetical protein [Candidatus Woesebacteria bacterium]